MSIYHSDKCTKEELASFKKKVLAWLKERGINKKVRAFQCYGGDVRAYYGYMEFTNTKSSFRREKLSDDGKQWFGTRGYHETKIANYVSFNRDEWDKWKNFDKPKNEYDKEYYSEQLRNLM